MEEYVATVNELLKDLIYHIRNDSPAAASNEFALTVSYIVGRFIQIHPFLNGNGRMSRIIWYWCCRKMRVSRQCRQHPRPEGNYAQIMAECMHGENTMLAAYILQVLKIKNERPWLPKESDEANAEI